MKKIVLFALTLCLAGCGSSGSSKETESKKESKQSQKQEIVYKDVSLDITEQTVGDNGTLIELAQFVGSDVDQDIQKVNNELVQEYSDFVADYSENSMAWIEYYTFPMNNDRYVNLVSTYNIFPTYGTYGVVESRCYDKLEGCFIDEIDALKMAGLTEDKIGEAIAEYVTQNESATPVGNESVGFYITADSQVTFLVGYEKVIEDVGYWTAFYSYDGYTVEYLGDRDSLIDLDLLEDTDTYVPFAKQDMSTSDVLVDTIVVESSDEEYLIDICRQYTVDHYALTTAPEDLAVQELSANVIDGHSGKAIEIMSPNDDLQEYVEFFICDDENTIYEYDVLSDSYSVLYSEVN